MPTNVPPIGDINPLQAAREMRDNAALLDSIGKIEESLEDVAAKCQLVLDREVSLAALLKVLNDNTDNLPPEVIEALEVYNKS